MLAGVTTNEFTPAMGAQAHSDQKKNKGLLIAFYRAAKVFISLDP